MLPAAQYHNLESQNTALFFFRETNYGGSLPGHREGGLVIDPEGVRICGFEWYSGDNSVFGVRLPLYNRDNTSSPTNVRFRYTRQPVELRQLGFTEGRLLNMQKPDCPRDTTGNSHAFLKNLVARALIDTETQTQLDPTLQAQCMSSVQLSTAEWTQYRARASAPTAPSSTTPTTVEP